MTADQLREMAEEIDNTVLQQVTNRGLAPGYVRDLVLAAVNEALEEQTGRIDGLVLGAGILNEDIRQLRSALDGISRRCDETTNLSNINLKRDIRAIIAKTREGAEK